MFADFDFSVLDSPEFKEDAVREELIAPILRRLGYLPTGPVRVQRSKTLIHPFVMIGAKRNAINIIPDYTLYAQDQALAIIEAKAPQELIVHSHHVEQTYSYAIHPEIRVRYYGLCNGRELVVYQIDRWDPLLRVSLQEIGKRWHEVDQTLNCRYLLNPELKGFVPDYGLTILKAGYTKDTLQVFFMHHLQTLMRAEDNLYIANTMTDGGDSEYLVTLDFSTKLFQKLLSSLPSSVANSVAAAMKHAPYCADVDGKIILSCSGHLGNLVRGEHEEFVPIRVKEISKVVYDPAVKLEPHSP